MPFETATPEPPHRPQGCVCYVVDEGYLLPTLVSALQARAQVAADIADVVIACLGPATARTAATAAVAEANGISFLRADIPPEMNGLHIMFGRFFLDLLLPADYRRILYIDG